MQVNETIIREVVAQVLSEVGQAPAIHSHSHTGRHGIFDCVDEAVAAARDAFEQLSGRTVGDRRRIIEIIRQIGQQVELGTMEMEETRIGRLDHKIEKLKTLGELTPGVEFLRSESFSGDRGLTVIEHAPFGVIGAITPVTHSLPTITGNAIGMIAAGNTLVVNPRQLDLCDSRADVGIGGRHLQPPRRRLDLRHGWSCGSTGRLEFGKTGHRGRPRKSARCRGRNRGPGSRRTLDH